MKRLAIATRSSRLALWQAGHVKQRLEALYSGLEVGLLPMTTRGDELIDQRLDQAGGKGLFIKELENALADGRADIAVHSMKDVPADLPAGFELEAILAREDPRDALVSNRYASLEGMPAGARVGTSSLRRSAQILERYPALEMRLLRGNVETRIAKLDRGDYDAVVLAVAGLTRLGLASRIRTQLALELCLPAPGQGALGIETLAARPELRALLAPLADRGTALCVRAERAVSRALGGSCTIPLAAYAEAHGARLRLRALVASSDGRRVARAEAEGNDPEMLGTKVAGELRRRGADEILADLA
ncbi:MAG TPA: hydroxymethylbilane synthase [Burkholderiales bacterium]|nr:hydroxymethylbilane synthase [Burkholderiales bacterium]